MMRKLHCISTGCKPALAVLRLLILFCLHTFISCSDSRNITRIEYPFKFLKNDSCYKKVNTYNQLHDIEVSQMYSMRGSEVFYDIDGDSDSDFIKLIQPINKIPSDIGCMKYMGVDTSHILIFENNSGKLNYKYKISNILCSKPFDEIWYDMYISNGKLVLDASYERSQKVYAYMYLSPKSEQAYIDSVRIIKLDIHDFPDSVIYRYKLYEMPSDKFDYKLICKNFGFPLSSLVE